MTEQPPSAEAMSIAEDIANNCMFEKVGARAIDALIAQRVSAETERCAKIAEEAAEYAGAGKPLVVVPARTFASDLALDIRDAIRAKGKP